MAWWAAANMDQPTGIHVIFRARMSEVACILTSRTTTPEGPLALGLGDGLQPGVVVSGGSRYVGTMGAESQHIGIGIDRPMSEVYEFAADPLNLSKWAAGLAGSKVEREGRTWFTESPMGRVVFTFAPRNDFGVLDHDVTLPSGQIVHNPLRVISDGDECEVVFTLRRRPDMTDDDFERDADAVARDLAALKAVVEAL